MKNLLAVFFLFLSVSPAFSQTPPSGTNVAPLETKAKQAILIDAATSAILFTKNPDEQMPTSSMSKVLTMYLAFEALKSGKLHLEDTLPVSEYAWKQSGSRMFLNVGENAKVEDLVRGVIVQSGNDAAVVLAEALGGSEGNFAAMMNVRAQELGMTHSHFMNATGMPDPQHYSTARDLARLALATMRDHPEYYYYYAELDFTHNNIKQGNRNPLLYRNIGVDGLKTGHTENAGYGLIASAVRGGRRMVVVVNGLSNMQERADEPAQILDWGYREFGLYPLLKKAEKLADVPVWLGVAPSVPLVPEKDVSITLPRAARAGLRVALTYDQPVSAPLAKGQALGKATLTAPGMDPMEVTLIAGEAVDQLNVLARFMAKLRLLFGKS